MQKKLKNPRLISIPCQVLGTLFLLNQTMPLSPHLLSFVTLAYCLTLISDRDIQIRSNCKETYFHLQWIARIERFLLRPKICQSVRAFFISQLDNGMHLGRYMSIQKIYLSGLSGSLQFLFKNCLLTVNAFQKLWVVGIRDV